MRGVQRGRVRNRTVDIVSYDVKGLDRGGGIPVDSTSRKNTVEYSR